MAKKKLKLNKRILLKAAGVIALLLLALGAGMFAQQFIKGNTAGPSVSKGATTGGRPDAVIEKPLPKEAAEAQALIDEGNNIEAEKKITESLTKSGIDNNTRYSLYVQQGINYGRQDKDLEAYNSYVKAATYEKTELVYNAIGNAASRLGKKQEAIAAYKEAIKHVAPDNPLRETEIRLYQQKIRNLGGQP